MITVTGATGALNGATVEQLLETVPPADITVVARDVGKAARFADRGVHVRRGGYDDPAALRAAFAGADQLLLVSSNDPGADAVALHGAAIDAAVAAGVGRVLYTSHQGADPASPFRPAQVHAATENLLADSGLAWTSLRNGFYLHSLGWLLGRWQESGTVSLPADGPVSWTSREDAAVGAAAILTSGRPVDGPVTLTASAAPTFAEVTGVLSEVVGRPIGFEIVDEDTWLAGQIAGGQPEMMARFTLGMYQAAAAGFFAGTDATLAALLGREPRTVRQELQQITAS
ncbi:NAD(P)H-binding protein [Nakamurella sp. YIM 132087]|uniref:NAD(P)H-binding protein n=1 Tax=Nakamurella alba TaxID=2665158 RepID=A0A7K1FKB6_9ACTN|nr:NAD(P)H-binding protein [Nakamurella alba]MTD14581.1 NAD(P)H-binding protein [Nakamurella alba]